MRHFQDSKLRLGAVVLATSLVAVGCGSADDVARAYSSELAEAIAEAGSKMKNPVSWLKSGKTAASQTDDLSKKLATSPSGLTDQSRKLPELVAETLRGQSVQTAIREVDATAVVASDIGASLASDATQSVSRSASVRSPGDEKTAAQVGEQLLKDLICSMATDMVAPPEATEVGKHASAFNYMQDKSADAIQSALKERAAGRLGAAFHWGFRWGTYGAGLANSANRHVASIGGQIESPDWQFTRAYIFVVKTCLAPPAR